MTKTKANALVFLALQNLFRIFVCVCMCVSCFVLTKGYQKFGGRGIYNRKLKGLEIVQFRAFFNPIKK